MMSRPVHEIAAQIWRAGLAAGWRQRLGWPSCWRSDRHGFHPGTCAGSAEVNAEARTVDVEPGLILGTLNSQLAPLGLMFGPDPASAERAAIGGVIGNNATGAHSIRYGMTADHVSRLQVALANGDLVWLDAADEQPGCYSRDRWRIDFGATRRRLKRAIRGPGARWLAMRWTRSRPNDVDLNWLLCGSEGTLATVVRAELGLVERPGIDRTRLAVVHFDSAAPSAGCHAAHPGAGACRYRADGQVSCWIKRGAAAGYRDRLTFVDGDPAALLVVEFVGGERELDAKIKDLRAHLLRLGYRGAVAVAESARAQD